YPTGLVANRTIQGNYLPHIDRYHIPFDTIPEFKNKALMVYEFDAGDVLGSYLYPAMAKSFRQAGFQWATQFAYDPLATAYGNTEYQTHYLNLAYTPSKAISLMIAGKAFYQLPLRKRYGTYPADSVFGAFRVSYKEELSEMNTAQEFYYSNTTRTKPANAAKLTKVAGVGSSPVVQYSGTGAYFLDKLAKGVWRLEVMPDAVFIRDPFAKASPGKEVTRIQWQTQTMQILLADLGKSFHIKGVNDGNQVSATAEDGRFQIQPGAYLLTKKEKTTWNGNSTYGALQVKEFVAPQPFDTKPFVSHQPLAEVSAGKPFAVTAQIVGVSPAAKVTLQLNNLAGVYKTVGLEKTAAYQYTAQVPEELVTPGLVNYRIMVQDGDKHFTFPGGDEGDPWAWDYYQNDTWQTFIAAENGKLELFNATTDRDLFVFPNLWRPEERALVTTETPRQLVLKLTAKELPKEGTMGFQLFIGDKLKGRATELAAYNKLVIRVRTPNTTAMPVQIGFISANATAFGATVNAGSTFKDIEIPLSDLKPAAFMLLPRPYPGFHAFWFKPSHTGTFSLNGIEKLEVRLGELPPAAKEGQGYGLEVEKVWLE
ncbi:MAG: membrane or secreted protein, partial [Rufibacter sp.]